MLITHFQNILRSRAILWHELKEIMRKSEHFIQNIKLP